MRRHLTNLLLLTFGLATPAAALAAGPVVPARITALSMFLQADWVVRGVMLLLLLASLATWAIAFAKHLEFRKAMSAIRADCGKLAKAPSLDQVPPLSCETSAAILAIARSEVESCIDISNSRSADAMTERLSVRIAAAEGDAVQSMRGGLSVLATIGAVAPFVGLFGTVWGIMNSFIGISQAQTTNLAVVAPGIAEALLATALGLVAAIPAVLLYNIFSRRMADFRRNLHNVSARVACLVSHETERAQVGHSRIAA